MVTDVVVEASMIDVMDVRMVKTRNRGAQGGVNLVDDLVEFGA